MTATQIATGKTDSGAAQKQTAAFEIAVTLLHPDHPSFPWLGNAVDCKGLQVGCHFGERQWI